MKRMIAEGIIVFPAGFPGIASVSVLNQSSKIQLVTNLDQMVVRLISQIVALWENITYREKKDLARSIRVDNEGFIFDGNYYQEAKEQFAKNRPTSPVELMALMMNRLAKYSEEYQASSSDVAQTLWQYKLGQEIIAPSQTDKIKTGKMNEIGLQKLLSKYLIEKRSIELREDPQGSQLAVCIENDSLARTSPKKQTKSIKEPAKI